MRLGLLLCGRGDVLLGVLLSGGLGGGTLLGLLLGCGLGGGTLLGLLSGCGLGGGTLLGLLLSCGLGGGALLGLLSGCGLGGGALLGLLLSGRTLQRRLLSSALFLLLRGLRWRRGRARRRLRDWRRGNMCGRRWRALCRLGRQGCNRGLLMVFRRVTRWRRGCKVREIRWARRMTWRRRGHRPLRRRLGH
jgi:hypothetical protein